MGVPVKRAIVLATCLALSACATPEGRRTALTVCGIAGVAAGGGTAVAGGIWTSARASAPLENGVARDFGPPVAVGLGGVLVTSVGAVLLDLASK